MVLYWFFFLVWALCWDFGWFLTLWGQLLSWFVSWCVVVLVKGHGPGDVAVGCVVWLAGVLVRRGKARTRRKKRRGRLLSCGIC